MPAETLHISTTGEFLLCMGVAFLVGAAVGTAAAVLVGLHARPGRKELAH